MCLRRGLLLVLLLSAVVTAGCGGESDPPSGGETAAAADSGDGAGTPDPERTVSTFIRGVRDDDAEVACDMLTADVKARLSGTDGTCADLVVTIARLELSEALLREGQVSVVEAFAGDPVDTALFESAAEGTQFSIEQIQGGRWLISGGAGL